ncbi:MAG: glycosyl transferase family 4 [Nanoarchaeota archaeon]|nr:glycosyl transferase family 4 [Nanoarchaeota archaeon]
MMTEKIILIPIILSFLVVLLLMPFWIRKSKQIGLVWNDMNKYYKTSVSGSGGIITVLGFLIGILIFIAYRVFSLNSQEFLVELFAILVIVLMLSGIGLIDDLLGWRRGGLSKRSRIILVALAAIPLMAINAGKSIINLPFFGTIDIGVFYPLIMIPLGIIGATTTFNFLAGFNGLEAGQGILLLSATGFVAFLTGNTWITIVSLIMIASLLAFLRYNAFPSSVFPGDSLTYSVGGLIAILAILGNFEKIAFFFFIPYIIETILKIRGKLIKQSFGKPLPDGSLDLLYNKIYGLEHLAIYFFKKINIKPTEEKVVGLIWIFQILVIIIGFIIFREGIFL